DVITSVAFSPDERQVLSGSWDNTLKLWDAASGALLRTFAGHSGWVSSVAFSPDGRLVLSGSWDKTLKLWNVASGAQLRTLKGKSDEVRSVAFSPDGRQVLAGGNKTLKLWDAASGQVLRTMAEQLNSVSPKPVDFTRDGKPLFEVIGPWQDVITSVAFS